MSDVILVYVTCKNTEAAQGLASHLVKEKLAACANIFQPHMSIYEWEGKLQSDQEVAMVVKSTKQRFSSLKERIIELHEYDCPCVVALDIADGHSPFLDWVSDQVSV